MQSPQFFLQQFFEARNLLFTRHQKDLENFQLEFCKGGLFYDKRLRGYLDEKIVDVEWEGGTNATITTTGNNIGKDKIPSRYILKAEEETWFLVDLQFQCSLCKGSGQSPRQCKTPEAASVADYQCKFCKGTGWCSLKRSLDEDFG